MIPPTLQSEPGPSQPLGRPSIADLISAKSTVVLPLRSFLSSIQECHPKVPYLFPDPPICLCSQRTWLSRARKPLSFRVTLLACLSNLFSESWLIVPDTGMLKEYNEGLFHSNGPVHHCFFTILTQAGGRKSRASVAVRTDAQILSPHHSEGPTADKGLITWPYALVP